MGLLLPVPRQAIMSSNLAATPTTNLGGTSMTAGAANVKGAWAQLFATAPFDVFGMTINWCNNSASAAVRNWLFDIGVGGAGVEVPIISNMMGTWTTTVLSAGTVPWYFPLRIPAGTRISARAQCSTAAATALCTIFLHGGANYQPFAFSAAEGIGVDTSTSKGTPITAGNTGAESAYTSIGGTTSREYRGILPMIGTDTVTTMTNLGYHLEYGYGSATLGERAFGANNTEYVLGMMPLQPDFMAIPSGTQLQMRAECSGTGEALQYGLMGFY